MNTRQLIDFNRISEAIDHLKNTFRNQPNLEDLAMKTNLSSFHFQRLFHEWAGTTPKKFLQYISIEHAKNMLKEKKSTLVDTAFETGLSGTGRLHDLFINIEGMTPAEYKNGGSGLLINYSFAESLFGNIVVASTTKGICYLAFYDDETIAFSLLQKQFPNAAYCCKLDLLQQNALYIFQKDCTSLDQVKLHLKGSPFS